MDRKEIVIIAEMPKKRGALTLRATHIPGNEAIDLRYVTLRHISVK